MTNEEFLKKVRYNLKHTVAVDFDGVLHGNSKGFHDGTIYDDPIQFTKESLEMLSKKFERIIIYSCKSRSERPLINGKTGTELVWDWLKKYNLDQYIFDVTSEKPIAALYIDDSAYRFENWISTMKFIEEKF